jgi:tetratricopeptide (TPR) repeat protein
MKHLFCIIAVLISTLCLGQTAEELYSKGLEKANAGNHAAAIEYFTQAIRVEPGVSSYIRRGMCKMETGDHAGAASDFTSSLKFKSDLPETYKMRADANMQLNKKNEAFSDLNAAISMAPGYAEAYENRAELKKQNNDLTGASEDLRLAGALRASTATDLLAIAKERYDSGRKSEACSLWRVALKMGDTSVSEQITKYCR